MRHNTQPKRILVIDGFAFRGLGCLQVIEKITSAASLRAKKALRPCQIFDLICGTSSGGIIAVLLGRLGMDCATAIEVYSELAKSLCGQDESAFLEKMLSNSMIDPTIFHDRLREIVAKYTGNALESLVYHADQNPHSQTQVMITITSAELNYTDCLRSYPPPQSCILLPFASRPWLIEDALRAVSATPWYTASFVVEGSQAIHDSACAGFNNPVILAMEEAKRLWPKEKLVVVSLGTEISELASPKMTTTTIPDVYANKFVGAITSKLVSADSKRRKALEGKALDIVKQMVAIAVDTRSAHNHASSQITNGSHYFRVDPPLPLSRTDLVDTFYASAVDEVVGKWLAVEDNRSTIQNISNLLVKEGEVAKKEDLIQMEPPPPPADTNTGYNPALDKKRPTNMTDYLTRYHVLFLIDDSGSMGHQGRWDETRDALYGVAEYAFKMGVKSVDVEFLNNPKTVYGLQSVEAVFEEVRPSNGTPTGTVLRRILDAQITKLDAAVGKPQYSIIPPLDIIVLTDGRPDNDSDPKEAIVHAVYRMRKAKHHPNSIGVQFVQIGDADSKELQALIGDKSTNGNMVDTVLYDGKLTSAKLERILLGAMHPNLRALIPA
ncbi:acyl transferase/acyl hydrolase/lysophospholipase [Abortiporus biennis]|nr:acyl transferase/acyl hydrolase/lysophospholipase [Abortiporus biennis]